MTRICYGALAAVLLLTFGCNDVPVGALKGSFTLKVNKSKDNTDPVKVDFLWVIDNSSSMCQEQAQLATSFDEFIKKIQSFVNIDYRIAVVTTDMLSEDHSGKFRHHPAGKFPFACTQTKILQCLSDQNGHNQCKQAFGENWYCEAPDKAKYIKNCNGTYNSKCVRRCDWDWQCDEEFELGTVDGCKECEAGLTKCLDDACAGDASTSCRVKAKKAECKPAADEAEDCKVTACVYKCLQPSGTFENSGCVLRPETVQCPNSDEMFAQMTQSQPDSDKPKVPYLVASNAQNLFKCLGVVGAEQHNKANLEQGLNAAIYALDRRPGAPNAEQARSFLREEAYLVTVFVSDEDDCSVDDGKKLQSEKFGRCACEADTDQDPKFGKLRPVNDAVNRVKALKSDPSRVLVAAIVGDSTAETTEDITSERNSYTMSKCGTCENPTDKHPLLFNTYICHSSNGKADYGRRYVEFVKRFGKNGILTNICDAAGIGPALETIADRIIRVFTKICLPKPLKDKNTLKVYKLGPKGACEDGSTCGMEGSGEPACSDGSVCRLDQKLLPESVGQEECAEENAACYTIQVSSDCPAEAGQKAVFFDFLLEPGSTVAIDYQACDRALTPDCGQRVAAQPE